jgi:type IV fimbrial biogenesis protein FimT
MLIDAHIERGFTLIEVLIAIIVITLLFMLGVPSFMTWMQNSQIRTAAQAIANGMQLARAEAIHRNVTVQIQLTSQSNGTGAAWTVSEVTTGTVVQKWSSAEGASGTQIAQAGGGILTFNQLGRVVSPNPSDNSASLLQVDVTSHNDSADPALRNLRVVVGQGGNARMCDANLPSSDPRAC